MAKGYGVIYAGVSPQTPAVGDIRNCTGMTIVLTFESFIGILFGSICGTFLLLTV
jgi:hypothetical protein